MLRKRKFQEHIDINKDLMEEGDMAIEEPKIKKDEKGDWQTQSSF